MVKLPEIIVQGNGNNGTCGDAALSSCFRVTIGKRAALYDQLAVFHFPLCIQGGILRDGFAIVFGAASCIGVPALERQILCRQGRQAVNGKAGIGFFQNHTVRLCAVAFGVKLDLIAPFGIISMP